MFKRADFLHTSKGPVMRSIAIALLLAASPAFALQHVDGDLTVKLSEAACDSPWLSLSLSHFAVPIKSATVTYAGTTVSACWIETEGKVILADEMGRAGFILRDRFQ